MERAQLSAARYRLHLSLEEAANRVGVSKATMHRWEKKGDIPQPYHLGKLCELYGISARELGFSEPVAEEQPAIGEELEPDVLALFRATYLPLRLLRLVCSWHSARYHELQRMIGLELGNNTMNDLNRRDALRFLALLPLEITNLSPRSAIFTHPNEEILSQCAAGIIACWHLRKGKELVFASNTLSAYIPTLKAMVQTAPAAQRKAAAELLVQCFLLKVPLAWNLTTATDAIAYAQQATHYCTLVGSRLLEVAAMRATAAAFSYANQWGQALQAAEKAKYILEQKEKSTPLQPIGEPIPHLVASYVYAGLATYQAYDGRKEDALHALKKAHQTFFERNTDEPAPIWIDHNIGNLLVNDGETHLYLNLFGQSKSSLEQIDTMYAHDTTISMTGRINALIAQVTAEVSRDDKPRDMEWCVDRWQRGIKGAKAVKSQKHFGEAIQAYTAMRAAWPGEQRVKDLREQIVHW